MLWFSSLPSFDTTTQQISFFYARPHHDKQNIHSDSQTICPTRRRNDGPMHKFKGKEQIKLVLDMSNDGPAFKMLESLMAATAGGKSGKGGRHDNMFHDEMRSCLMSTTCYMTMITCSMMSMTTCFIIKITSCFMMKVTSCLMSVICFMTMITSILLFL